MTATGASAQLRSLRSATAELQAQISERESNQQHFLSITYTINATSREQVVALANALQASKDVIMLIEHLLALPDLQATNS